MTSRDILALVAGATCLLWSASTAIQTYESVQRSRSATHKSDVASTRLQTMTSRASELIQQLPRTSAGSGDTALSQTRILANARKAGARIDRISSDRGVLHVRVGGELDAILKMLDERTRTVSIHSASTGTDIEAEIEYAPPAITNLGETIEEMERTLARWMKPASTDTTSETRAKIASLFRSPSFTTSKAQHASSTAGPAREGEYIFDDLNPATPQLRFLGTISNGKRDISGVFQDARGLVIKAKAGDEIAEWRIVKIDANSATLARVGTDGLSIPGKPVRLEQKGLN